MPSRLALVGTCLLGLTIGSIVWGCDQPETPPPAVPPTVNVPDSAFVDSVRAALDRVRAPGSSTAADSTALRRWADSLANSLQAKLESGRSRELASSRNHLKQSLRAYRLLADSAEMAAAMHVIGKTHAAQSQFETAIGRYKKALAVYRSLDNREKVAALLNEIGNTRRYQDRYEEALTSYQAALRIQRDLGNRASVARVLNNIGLVHWKQDRYEEALARYRTSLDIKRNLGKRPGIATTLNNMGLILWNQGRYEEALARYRESMRIKRDLGDREGVASTLNNMGIILWKQGRYEKALTNYRAALQIDRRRGNREDIAQRLNNIGLVYKDQGQYETALARYRSSLQIARELGNREDIARTLGNIGTLHRKQGQYEEALTRYRAALPIERTLGNRKGIAQTLENVGNIHRHRGRHEEALGRYQEALRMYREIGNRGGIASALRHIGNARREQEQWKKALTRYRASLRIERDIGNRKEAAQTLSRLGSTQLRNGSLRAATDTLRRAVERAEKLRLNVTSPEARRSLLSTQIGTYRALSSAYAQSGQPDSVLRSVEQTRARLLADRLAGTVRGDTTFSVPPAASLRRTLDPDEAAFLYANAGSERPLTALVVTRDTTYARVLPDSAVRARIMRTHSSQLRRLQRVEGPLTAALGSDNSSLEIGRPSLAETIRLYRYHLTREQTGAPIREDLARQLYGLLVAPTEAVLQHKDAVTIIPTGALGYLPFETLRDATGNYLVQETHVRYAQSLTTLHQLEGRTHPDSRQPLLAVGNPEYGSSPSTSTGPLLATTRGDSEVGSEEQAASLYRSAEQRMDRGRSPSPTYAQLGYDQWPTLYGTELEVRKLKRAVGSETTALTGAAASEERIRQMSEQGHLARYRRIHFATHGVAVPEASELSALVLSQVGASDSLAARDGYLTMREIADLRLRADVAVLSACRTGLGRIVAGEGVVNLSHAFLRAGANATLVSQWRVLDWSTQQFMTAVHRKSKRDDTSFAEAVTQVKRDFIDGQFGARNADPLRWAPFVYYGHE